MVHAGAGFVRGGAELVRDTTDLAVYTGADIVREGADLLHSAADVVAGDEHRHRCSDCPRCGAGTARVSNGPALMGGAAGVNQIVGAGMIGLANRGDLVHGVDYPTVGLGWLRFLVVLSWFIERLVSIV